MEGGPSERAFFALKEELRATGVEGIGPTRKMEQRFERERREASPTQAKVGDPAKAGSDLIYVASGSSA